MNKIDIKNLTGKCLVSLPNTQGIFAETVIYICSHDRDGAMGFIVNKRLHDISFQDLASQMPFPFLEAPLAINLYNGGPLEKAKGFILHSSEYQLPDSLNTGNGITVSSSLDVLKDIAFGKGPKQKIIALGYAGWAPQQLEKEITDNHWLITEATPELILGSDDENKWNKALSSLGINFNNLAPSFGHS